MFTSRMCKGLHHLPDARDIRMHVFVEEQGFALEFDETDDIAWHVVLYAENTPIATGRTYPCGEDTYAIGRIAVERAYRGTGAGRAVVQTLEDMLRAEGVRFAELSAQVQAQGFYEKLGYGAYGSTYLDEHCPHIRMRKML